MTTYVLLDIVMLAVCAGLAYLLDRKRPLNSKTIVLLIPLLFLTAVFDNILTSLPIVTYIPANILGLHIGSSPIEDFAYSLAAVILIPALNRRFYEKNI